MPSIAAVRNTAFTVALLSAACAAPGARAEGVPAAYDTPSISVGVAGQGKQVVSVAAGATGARAGFTIRWMTKAQFDQYGGVWPRVPGPGEGSASFTGTPTLNTAGGLYTTFQLGQSQSIDVEIGDLDDETGVTGSVDEELASGTDYVFLAVANGDAHTNASTPSVTVNCKTKTPGRNCTYTQGYWKNHSGAWPVSSLPLGSRSYTQSELLAVFGRPAKGNGLVFLAHQVIAAKLNVANGADPTAVSQAIVDADALIGSKIVPPLGTGYIAPRDASALTETLDDFNNGISGPGHCGSTPVRPSSWGAIKAIYGR